MWCSRCFYIMVFSPYKSLHEVLCKPQKEKYNSITKVCGYHESIANIWQPPCRWNVFFLSNLGLRPLFTSVLTIPKRVVSNDLKRQTSAEARKAAGLRRWQQQIQTQRHRDAPNLRLSEAKRPGNAAAKRHGAGRSVWNIGMSWLSYHN